MRTALSILRIFAPPLIVAVLLALALRENVARLFSIPSSSMAPTLERGDHVIVTPYRSALWRNDPRRGDVVVFRRENAWFVKRVVAEPGDSVEIRWGEVRINGSTLAEPYLSAGEYNGEPLQRSLGPDEFFVMGDHRSDSLDSRSWGALRRDAIWGRARVIFWSDAASDFNAPALAAEGSPLPTPVVRRVRWSRIGTRVE